MFAESTMSKAQILVGAQFALMFLAIMPYGGSSSPDVLGIVLLCVGMVLGAWVLKTNSPENFNISPLPKEGANLCFHGPYHFIRHPMYLALILVVGGIALCNSEIINAIAWAVLVGVLDFKARFEERLLEIESGSYRAYIERSWRFIPFIY
jgi:protein-S-isoprenylcysteine O-methyltransferase Ste14